MQLKSPNSLEEARDIVGHLDPARITDMEAYNEYLELEENPIFTTLKWQKTSKGDKVCIAWFPTQLQTKIVDLPKGEQTKILTLHKRYKQLMSLKNTKLRKAYGTYVTKDGKPSQKSSVFDQREKEIITLFGRMFTAEEVLEICVKDWRMPVSLGSVRDFRKAHAEEIMRQIEEHKRTYSDIRLGYKRSRLEELTWLYSVRKRLYEATKKGDDHRLLLMTIDQIRKEVEGDSIRIDGHMQLQVEHTIEEHLKQELLKNFSIKEIIIARVAARMGIDSTKMITELNKTYYAKFLQGEDISYEMLPPAPSVQTYDFDQIRKVNEQLERKKQAENQAKKQAAEDPSRLSTLDNVKAALIAKLKQSQERLNYTKNSLTGKFIDKANKHE